MMYNPSLGVVNHSSKGVLFNVNVRTKGMSIIKCISTFQ